MKKEKVQWLKQNIGYGAFGAFFALLLLGIIVWSGQNTSEYEIVVLGDSVVGNQYSESSITDVMQQRLDMTVFNGALGGTGMAFQNHELVASEVPSLWCMAELAKAICYDDWGAQKACVEYGDNYRKINTQTLKYFKNRIEELSHIDFDKVKILIIEHGTNDYNSGCPLDNESDPYDITTYGGALRSSLRLLKETYPDLRIVLVTPVYCEFGEDGARKCYNTDFGGGYLDDYVEKEKEIAADFGVEVIDAYHNSGIHEENIEEYLLDRLHPTQEGTVLLGEFLADYFLQ